MHDDDGVDLVDRYGDDWADDWDDELSSPPREEPYCGGCNDSRYVDGRIRRWRPCPYCNPTRLDLLISTVGWRWWQLKNLIRRRPQAGPLDGEPPF